MAETRILAPVLELVEQAGGKAILIGDPHQLPAVGAGGLFAGIVERHGAVELTENRRQHDELERDALARVRAGVGRDYLAYAEKRERLVVSESPVTTRDAPARRLVGARPRRPPRQRHDRAPPPRRRRAQRARPRAHGHRRPPRPASASPSRTREFAAGDRVVCLRNSDAPRRQERHPRHRRTRRPRAAHAHRRDRPRRPTSSSAARYLEAGNVRHAYALTGHAAQGLTVERAFVLGAGEARLQEWGYVALSRARTETRLYVTGDAARAREPLPRPRRPRPAHPPRPALEESAIERARRRPAPAPVRAAARRACRDRAHATQRARPNAAQAARAAAARDAEGTRFRRTETGRSRSEAPPASATRPRPAARQAACRDRPRAKRSLDRRQEARSTRPPCGRGRFREHRTRRQCPS